MDNNTFSNYLYHVILALLVSGPFSLIYAFIFFEKDRIFLSIFVAVFILISIGLIFQETNGFSSLGILFWILIVSALLIIVLLVIESRIAIKTLNKWNHYASGGLNGILLFSFRISPIAVLIFNFINLLILASK